MSLLGGAAAPGRSRRIVKRPRLIKRIGYLTLATGPSARQSGAFEDGLRQLGYKARPRREASNTGGAPGVWSGSELLAKELVET